MLVKILLCCLMGFPFWGKESPPTYPVYRFSSPPVLDGKVDDAAWKNAVWVRGFYVLGGDFARAKQSQFAAGWTDDSLFVAMVCDEPDIALIHPKRKDGDALWAEDSVEIFIMFPAGGRIMHFVISMGGARVTEEPFPLEKWQAAVHRGQDSYSVEVRIPFDGLGVKVKEGDRWRAAFCRNIYEYKSGGDRFTSFPKLKQRFREPENFCFLDFRGAPPSPQVLLEQSHKMTAPYRKHLRREARKIRRTLEKYEKEIEKALNIKTLTEEATGLFRLLDNIRSLPAEPDLDELREYERVVLQGEGIERRCEDLKYRRLIEDLLK